MEKYKVFGRYDGETVEEVSINGEWYKADEVETVLQNYDNVISSQKMVLEALELKYRLLQQDVWSKDRIIERANIDAEDWLKRIQLLESANRELLAMNSELESKLEKLK